MDTTPNNARAMAHLYTGTAPEAKIPVQLVDSTAIARMLSMSTGHVRKLAASGAIPSTRINGGCLRFDADKVARHLGLID